MFLTAPSVGLRLEPPEWLPEFARDFRPIGVKILEDHSEGFVPGPPLGRATSEPQVRRSAETCRSRKVHRPRQGNPAHGSLGPWCGSQPGVARRPRWSKALLPGEAESQTELRLDTAEP